MLETRLLAQFKNLFENQKKNLLELGQKSLVNEEFHIQKDDVLDESDLTSSELEQSMRIRLRNREALYLKKIEASLRKIQDGSFGDCDSCGDDISLKRLEARPTTTLCVSC